jgi:hypothetical protein
LGPEHGEDEGDHLRRVAAELSASGLRDIGPLKRRLFSADSEDSRRAALELAAAGGRDAVLLLRQLLEGDDPASWESAIHALRQTREREGWLCLESVALGTVDELESVDRRVSGRAAIRLLMMGRTKTMDRLFRAADGHSRSIPVAAAARFVEVAIASLPEGQGRVLSLRLGAGGKSLTVPEVAAATGLVPEQVRELEAQAWATVQSPREWSAVNSGAARTLSS